jgi:hypothetical protein
MSNELPYPNLGIGEEEAQSRFEALQQKLVPLWKSIQAFNQDEQTIVVVPSMNIDSDFQGGELQAYEERFLFLLLLLRQPRARLIYVTSQTINQSVIDYYLDLLPGVISSHARKRLHLIAPMDSSFRPLSLKLLERPKLLEHIRSLIPDKDRAHLVPYNTTKLERDLALQLGIPMYGCDPKHWGFGTKSGCRQVFADEGVPHPEGVQNLSSLGDLHSAIIGLRARKPSMASLMVKLNEGVSGEGNALMDLSGLPAPGGAGEADAVMDRLRTMKLESADATFDSYIAKLGERGGVIEERLVGEDFRSPSVQLRVTPLGKVELLSTHDQVLGGPSGQSYLGCRFPAEKAYAPTIMRHAQKVGDRLAREGVIGRFALDFVAFRPNGGEWETAAIEINLRKGGTTHPFLTLQFLTDGRYDPESGVFTTPMGQEKHFVASDHHDSPLYRVFTPDDLFDIVCRHGIHFDQARQTGVVFHMMAALADCGSLGMTAVGNSQAEADAMYKRADAILNQEARIALGLPPADEEVRDTDQMRG